MSENIFLGFFIVVLVVGIYFGMKNIVENDDSDWPEL